MRHQKIECGENDINCRLNDEFNHSSNRINFSLTYLNKDKHLLFINIYELQLMQSSKLSLGGVRGRTERGSEENRDKHMQIIRILNGYLTNE